MSKSIVMSVAISAALSLGGWLASCGVSGGSSQSAVVVQVPDGCFLMSPKNDLGGISGGPPVIALAPGKRHFVLDCDGRQIEIDREVKPDDRIVRLSSDDLQ